jgi:hypothetical protein
VIFFAHQNNSERAYVAQRRRKLHLIEAARPELAIRPASERLPVENVRFVHSLARQHRRWQRAVVKQIEHIDRLLQT